MGKRDGGAMAAPDIQDADPAPDAALVRQLESADPSMRVHEVVATEAEVFCPGNSVAGDGEVKGLCGCSREGDYSPRAHVQRRNPRADAKDDPVSARTCDREVRSVGRTSSATPGRGLYPLRARPPSESHPAA